MSTPGRLRGLGRLGLLICDVPINNGTHMPNYQRGRAWAAAILGAVYTTVPAALINLAEADRLLGPLGNITDPEELRDFVAGAARQAEDDRTPPF